MAYAALVSLSQTLVEQVIDGYQYRFVSPDEEHHIKSLHEKLVFLQSFLEGSAYNSRSTLDSLEERIRDATYQAEDVIESHISDWMHSKGKLQADLLQKKFYVDLRIVMENIGLIVEEIMQKKRNYRFEDPAPASFLGAGPSRQAPSSRDKMVGFDEDLQETKGRLCGESPDLQIMPIVGMGGIGKTTLAKNIFDDPLIAETFDVRAWTTVSQEYCMQDILVGLANYLNPTYKSDEQLAQRIYQHLKGRRYLIYLG